MNNGTGTVASQNVTHIRKTKHPVSSIPNNQTKAFPVWSGSELDMKETSNIINSVLLKVNI